MPAAEKRKTAPGQSYGEAGKQAEFIEATSPVATPQVPQNVPQAPAPTPVAPQAFKASETPFSAPDQMLVAGREMDPEEAAIMFSGSGEVSTQGIEGLRDWWPAIAAMGRQSDAHPYFRALADAAERLLEEDEA